MKPLYPLGICDEAPGHELLKICSKMRVFGFWLSKRGMILHICLNNDGK